MREKVVSYLELSYKISLTKWPMLKNLKGTALLVAPWYYHHATALANSSTLPSPDLLLSLLVCVLITVCNMRGYMTLFICYIRGWDCRYRLLGTVIHISKIKWWLLKNLHKCGFRHNLLCFLQKNGCTDLDSCFLLFYMVHMMVMVYLERFLEIKLQSLKNLL